MNTSIATPEKKIVSISGKPIKSQITTTKDGKKVSGDEAIAKLATQLPDVKGYRLLCIVPEAEETYDGGIVKSADVKKIEEGEERGGHRVRLLHVGHGHRGRGRKRRSEAHNQSADELPSHCKEVERVSV